MSDQKWTVPSSVNEAALVRELADRLEPNDYICSENGGIWVLAADPTVRIELYADRLHVVSNGQAVDQPVEGGSPYQIVHDTLCSAGVDRWDAYGWFAFECSRTSWTKLHPDTLLASFIIPALTVEIGSGTITASGNVEWLVPIVEDVLSGPLKRQTEHLAIVDIKNEESKSNYITATNQAIAEIRAGLYEKVIISRSVAVCSPIDFPATYETAYGHNNPARSFLFKMGDSRCLGFSPEMVVSVDDDRRVRTEPLAGTRALGHGEERDELSRWELVNDPKEIVEHAISVREAFGEIEAVSIRGSSSVCDYMSVRQRGSVQHIASTVNGKLSPNTTAWDALSVLFPAITASGVPKGHAIDAIQRIEEDERGLYAGAVVVASYSGSLDAALVLRSVYSTKGKTWLRAGAGIVAQSNPEREFEETCEKLLSVSPFLVQKSAEV
ncbi:salicylate synthase [Nocardia rhamnosiphila]|uniref:salicylate synthase n=1 Tax=Nocardia rhamnosiphila TaxID=426716 RepID=UPI0033F25C9A